MSKRGLAVTIGVALAAGILVVVVARFGSRPPTPPSGAWSSPARASVTTCGEGSYAVFVTAESGESSTTPLQAWKPTSNRGALDLDGTSGTVTKLSGFKYLYEASSGDWIEVMVTSDMICSMQ